MKTSKSLLTKGSLALSLLQVASANPVDFTTGFIVDSPLEGQNNWTTNNANSPSVVTSGVTDNGFDFAIFQESAGTVSPGTSFTSTIDFSFSILSSDSVMGGPLIATSLFAGNDASVFTGGMEDIHNRLSAVLRKTNLTNEEGNLISGVRLSLVQDSGSTNPTENGVQNDFAQTNQFSDSLIGLDLAGSDPTAPDADEDLTSANLQLSLTLTAGFDEDDWAAIIVLTNLDTGQIVGSHSRANISFTAPIDSEVYGGFGFGQIDTRFNIDPDNPRVVNRFELTQNPISAGTQEVNFTESEGFTTSSDLNANLNWSSTNEPDVDAVNGRVAFEGFVSAIYQPFLGLYMPQATFESSIDFSFQEVIVVDEDGNPILGNGGTPLVNVAIYNQRNASATGTPTVDIISAVSDGDSGNVTITTTEPHGLSVDESIFVTGLEGIVDDTNPNGLKTIISVTETSITYTTNTFEDTTYTLNEADFTPPAINQLRAGFQGNGTTYSLALQSGSANFPQRSVQRPYIDGVDIGRQLSSNGVNGEDLGLNITPADTADLDTQSDNLRLTLKLSAGDTSNAWIATMQLFNLDGNDPELALIEQEFGPITNFDALRLFGGFGSGQGNTNASVADRVVSRFSYNVTYPVVATDGISIGSSSFDGTAFTVAFTGNPSTTYRLTASPDLTENSFVDLGDAGAELTVETDIAGNGTFTYPVPTPAAVRNFFRVSLPSSAN